MHLEVSKKGLMWVVAGINQLAAFLIQTFTPDALLSSIEAMEKERNGIIEELSLAESLVLESQSA